MVQVIEFLLLTPLILFEWSVFFTNNSNNEQGEGTQIYQVPTI